MSGRAQFIWLPEQRIEHAAAFASLRGAPLRRTEEGVNRWVLARRAFDLPGRALAARLRITADGRYCAWMNGQRIGAGPVRASPWFQRFDSYDISAMLRPGRNALAVLVHVPGVDLAWYETVKGAWQPAFGDGGLFADLAIETSGARTEIGSAADWRIRTAPAWRRDTARGGWGQDFLEDFDANEFDADWLAPSFDDGAWSLAQVLHAAGSDAAHARGWGPVEPFPILLPTEIPAPEESACRPHTLLWVKSVLPRPDLPLESRLYSELLVEPREVLATDADALLTRDDATTVVRTLPGHDTALMFVFAACHAGRPFIELDAAGGEILEIAVAECFPGEFGLGLAGDGLRRDGALHCAHVFRYRARPGRQYFEKFNWTAVRALQLVVRNAPAGIGIRRIGSISTHYPAVPVGTFACSDPVLTQLWEVGRHTVLQCMHDAWVDCPGREARQWVGDAIVDFDIAAVAFGTSIYPLHRQFLQQVAESQRQDGLVRMFAPGDIAAEGLVIPDFSLLWIIGAARYLLQTGDSSTIGQVLPSIERALAWFERLRDPHGLLADIPYWHFIEWADIGREGESAAINALYVGALDSCAAIAAVVERPRLAARCLELRARTAAALNARHWDAERGVYVDSVDPLTGARRARVSQHANALMLLFGIAAPERRAAVVAAITDSARLKLTAAPPIVPEAAHFDATHDIVRVNSFFAHFVYDALAQAGQFDWVLREIRATYGPMLAAGATTLWESFAPAASLCHGFSATPVFQLSRHALGIFPTSPGFEAVTVRPDPGDLLWARGRVETIHGAIVVDWSRTESTLEVTIEHPAGCRPTVEPPAGHTLIRLEDLPAGIHALFRTNVGKGRSA
jgi:hypothetical protein